MTSKIEIMCQRAKIKMTPQRKIIAHIISEASDHPDADEIYKRANAADSNISLATVYRTIALFEQHNLINKLELGEGKFRYEINACKSHHHHHLIDLEDGMIIEFVDEELEKLKEKIAYRLGYKLINHRLELYGEKIKK